LLCIKWTSIALTGLEKLFLLSRTRFFLNDKKYFKAKMVKLNICFVLSGLA